MHELSLVKSLLRQVDKIRFEVGGGVVDAIQVEVGPLAGVEPLLMRSAFEQIAADFEMGATQLIIDEVPLLARCPICGPVAVEPVRIQCQSCGSPDVTITGGDEVRLQSVTVQCAERL
jgi:hydrogenase nickel incorporation protein HypA/HybF